MRISFEDCYANKDAFARPDETVLRIGMPGDFIPFGVMRGSHLIGHDVELGRKLAHTMGLAPVFIRTSWPTLMEDFGNGRFDVAMGGVTPTRERRKKAFFLPSYAPFWKTVLARRASLSRIGPLRRPEDLNRPDLTVMKNPGGTNEAWVDRHLTRARVLCHEKNEEIPKRVAIGEADFMVTDVSEASWYASRDPRLIVLPIELTEREWKAVMVDRAFRDIPKLEAAWKTLSENGVMKALRDEWLRTDE